MKQIDLYDVNMNYLYTYSLIGKGAPYFNHTRQAQIADSDNGRLWQDNFSFDVKINEDTDDVLANAAYLIWSDSNDRQYLYRIQSKVTTSGGSPVPTETITAVNAFSFELPGRIEAKTFMTPTARQVFEYIMAGSGWNLHEVDGMANDSSAYEISDSNESGALNAFVAAVTAFDAEVDAWIDFDQFGNMVKNVDVVKHLYPIVDTGFADVIDVETGTVLDSTDVTELVSENNGRTLSYYSGLAGFTRTEDWTQFYTKFYVSGLNGAQITSVNDGKPYIVDEEANDRYNGGGNYLVGELTNEYIAQPQALLDWAKNEMKKYNHPAYNYEITTEYMSPDEMPKRGETVLIVNFDITPALVVLAEIVNEEIHDDNPASNIITLGEFRTLNPTTPNLIKNMQDQSNIEDLINQVKNDSRALKINVLTPDGTDFSLADQQKRAIAQVLINSEYVTNYIERDGFIWQHIDENGRVDEAFANRFDTSKVGYMQTLNDDFKGTLRVSIDTDKISTTPSIYSDQSVSKTSDNKTDDTFDSVNLVATGNEIYKLTTDGRVVEQSTGKSMVVTNLGNNSIAYRKNNLLFLNANNQIVIVGFKEGITANLNSASSIVTLPQDYLFSYDAGADMFILTDGMTIFAVNGTDIYNGIIPTYKIYDIGKLGYKGSISSISSKYPNVFLVGDNYELMGVNVINQSPIFTYDVTTTDTGFGNVCAVSYAKNKVEMLINNIDGVYEMNMIERKDITVEGDNPLEDLHPTDVESQLMIDTNTKVNALKSPNSVSIGFITDTHIDMQQNDGTINALRHVKALSYYASTFGLDYIVHGGDLDDGNQPKETTMSDIKAGISALNLSGVPFFVLDGNHDDNSGYARDVMNQQNAGKIDHDEAYPVRLSQFDAFATMNTGEAQNPYGSYSFVGQNIVAIFLNSFDGPEGAHDDGTMLYISHGRSSFMQKQITWLAATLKAIPNSSQVMVFSHSSIRGVFRDPANLESFADNQHGGNEIWGMLSAFQSSTSYKGEGYGFSTYDAKTHKWTEKAESNHLFKSSISVNFSGKTPNRIIGVFSGHTHQDKALRKEGIWNIETCCSIYNRGNIKNRQIGSNSEDCWDVIVVDPTTRQLDLVRYGAGKSRHFDY